MKDKEIQEEIERLNEDAIYCIDFALRYTFEDLEEGCYCHDTEKAVRLLKQADWLQRLIKYEEALGKISKHRTCGIECNYPPHPPTMEAKIAIKALKENDQ